MNYIFLANGYETVEALAVVDMMRRAKLPLTMVSMNDDCLVTTAHNIPMMADMPFAACDFSDAEMLILPGGQPGTTNLQNDERLAQLLKAHNEKGGLLAAICAAPQVLGGLGILSGKQACCYPGCEGGMGDAEMTMKAVTVSGNCITSRGMGTAILFGAAIIEALIDKATADLILNQIQWNTSEE